MCRALPRALLTALGEVVCPLAYTGDTRLDQARLRGAPLILLNWLVVTTGLGLGVSTSLLHTSPPRLVGLRLPPVLQLSLLLPRSNLLLRTAAGDLEVKLPPSLLDMPVEHSLAGSLQLPQSVHHSLSLLLPALLALLSLAPTLARGLTLGLDCALVPASGRRRGPARAGGRLVGALGCGFLGVVMFSVLLVVILLLIVGFYQN